MMKKDVLQKTRKSRTELFEIDVECMFVLTMFACFSEMKELLTHKYL